MPRTAVTPRAEKNEPKTTGYTTQAKTVRKRGRGPGQTKTRGLWAIPPPPLKRAGSRLPLPCARVDGLEPLTMRFPSRARRQAIFLGATEPHAIRPKGARREHASRPRPVGGVNGW